MRAKENVFRQRFFGKVWNKTKIVATLGPASSSYPAIKRLVLAGADIFRLNFSHASPSEHLSRIEAIRRISRELRWPVAIIQDLPGPKMRIGQLSGEMVVLRNGGTVSLVPRARGDKFNIPLPYPALLKVLRKGQNIFLNDGMIKLKVIGKSGFAVICRVVEGGELRSRKGVNIPGADHPIRRQSRRDREYLKIGLDAGVDFVALSFIKEAKDVRRVRDFIKARNKETKVIAKIEKQEALDDLRGIIREADGIMIARGDLGIEIPLEKVALTQKKIIRECARAGKPVITATQMLQSMVVNPSPTRAEVTDITNAILDGTDAIMLSEETAVGRYPVKTVKMMVRVGRETENFVPGREIPFSSPQPGGEAVLEAVTRAVHFLSSYLKVDAVIVPTLSGTTASLLSRLRTRVPIIAVTVSEQLRRQLQLKWGILPVKVDKMGSLEEMLKKTGQIASRLGILKKGGRVIITSETVTEKKSRANTVQIREIA